MNKFLMSMLMVVSMLGVAFANIFGYKYTKLISDGNNTKVEIRFSKNLEKNLSQYEEVVRLKLAPYKDEVLNISDWISKIRYINDKGGIDLDLTAPTDLGKHFVSSHKVSEYHIDFKKPTNRLVLGFYPKAGYVDYYKYMGISDGTSHIKYIEPIIDWKHGIHYFAVPDGYTHLVFDNNYGADTPYEGIRLFQEVDIIHFDGVEYPTPSLIQ